jgi:hypothetical protein
MQLALRFWTKLMMWTGILFLILITVSLVGGQSVGTVMAHIPVWGGLALVLAAFPAGLASHGTHRIHGPPHHLLLFGSPSTPGGVLLMLDCCE